MLAATPVIAAAVPLFFRFVPPVRPVTDRDAVVTAAIVFVWLWIALASLLTRDTRKRLDDFSPIAGVVVGGIFALALLAALTCLGGSLWSFLFQ